MKINWKVRFRNRIWLGSFLSLIVSFVYSMLALFDVFPSVTQNHVAEILNLIGMRMDNYRWQESHRLPSQAKQTSSAVRSRAD